jgi:pimeloyl-ACP methyl ester carboxylesterase
MESARAEDRVFGRPETYPPQPLVTRASRSFDLLSVAVEGAEAAYAEEGRRALPALVFLHGWGASSQFWKYQLGAFAPRFRCVAPDLAGFGRSACPRDRSYTVESYVSWLEKFLDALGLERVRLVGHSMGGSIALLFAIERPARVERLVVVNPLLEARTAFTLRSRLLAAPGIRWLAWWGAHLGGLRRWVTRDFSYVQGLEDGLAVDLVRGSYRSTMRSLRSCLALDLVPRLASLSVPTLSIGTDRDRVILGSQYERVPTPHRARIGETGHLPMIERPEEFNRVLDRFLGRQDGAPGP